MTATLPAALNPLVKSLTETLLSAAAVACATLLQIGTHFHDGHLRMFGRKFLCLHRRFNLLGLLLGLGVERDDGNELAFVANAGVVALWRRSSEELERLVDQEVLLLDGEARRVVFTPYDFVTRTTMLLDVDETA